MRQLLFFSNNKNKIIEIKKIFNKFNLELLSLNDLNISEEPEESGHTFEENAKIKSDQGFNKTGIPCFADDSGICIEALNGGPGVESKRFLNASFAVPPKAIFSLLTLLIQYKPTNKPIIKRPKVKKAKTEILISSEPPSIEIIEKLLAINFDSLEPKAAPSVPPKEIKPKYCFAFFRLNRFIATTQKMATTKKL